MSRKYGNVSKNIFFISFGAFFSPTHLNDFPFFRLVFYSESGNGGTSRVTVLYQHRDQKQPTTTMKLIQNQEKSLNEFGKFLIFPFFAFQIYSDSSFFDSASLRLRFSPYHEM